MASEYFVVAGHLLRLSFIGQGDFAISRDAPRTSRYRLIQRVNLDFVFSTDSKCLLTSNGVCHLRRSIANGGCVDIALEERPATSSTMTACSVHTIDKIMLELETLSTAPRI
jgi:hypothetical protein